ncbi:hypothetical protein [Phytohabitans kaempferiae]|uniref:Right handed beta helix domain-containing protein n=1 Tax=Phytohabitans kaempferiae TaxID=1620943 RepID=A0ABV6MC40_9ACTN
MRITVAAAGMLAVALVAGSAACGGSGEPDTTAEPSVTAQSGPPETAAAASPSPSPPPTGTARMGRAPASPTPSKSSSAPPSRPTGKPGPDNTGVPAGTKLKVVTGDQTYSKSNQVLSGLDIRGYVRITGKNVTLRNSIVRGGAERCNASAVISVEGSARIEYTEIRPSNPSPCLDGVRGSNITMVAVDIHGVVDGVKAGDNVLIEHSYIHDLSWFASDPNQGGGSTHNDAVQSFGDRNITLRHNTLLAGRDGNAAWQVTQDDGGTATNLRVENNWLDGGGCTLNFAHKGGPTPMTGIHVVNNRFGRGSSHNCPILISTQTRLSTNSGNVWMDTGEPIPRPQQHD